MKTSIDAAPVPVVMSAALLAQHSLTADEYQRIVEALGRVPSLTELGIFSVMWSEHCSYKSSRVHLKRLPTRGPLVVQGPGENAGIIDVGEGWACAFKIESHNHPSYIEPFQGATTGVGGILRDIFTMGARPLAVMDSLRFGPLSEREGAEDESVAHKNQTITEGVVAGVASYGNCFGVPNLGGETKFESCYSGNPLVNAFALGLVRKDEIFYAKATGVGNPVIYVGAKTGRDGIHGATMASEEFKEGSEQKRPNVQVGDPFMEKLLLEACLEAMQTGAVVGIQDMGAAGLTCSTCEMGGRGGVGLEVELDFIPQRETGMTSYEIMLSESQERMLLVAEKGREQEVLSVFEKWGLDGVICGVVIGEPRLKITHHGVLEADIPNVSLTDDAPLYHRPVGEWKAPVSGEPSAAAKQKLAEKRDYAADLKALLGSGNISSKRWVHEQYDSMVQTNTVEGPGAEAGVMRIKGTGKTGGTGGEGKAGAGNHRPGHERGLAMALDGNGRWCWLNPKEGAKLAVAEASRKVACTGAKPVAATNCLNFGNPEKPEIMRQLSDAIDGIAEACIALGTPVTGGNVSLYNETRGEGIFPTPVIGIVGILEDVSQAVRADFSHPGDALLLLDAGSAEKEDGEGKTRALGASEFAKVLLGEIWGEPAAVDLKKEADLQKRLQALAKSGLLHAARDISDGGIAVTLAEGCFAYGTGVDVEVAGCGGPDEAAVLFGERPSRVVVAVKREEVSRVQQILSEGDVTATWLGVVTDGKFKVHGRESGAAVGEERGCTLIETTTEELRRGWAGALKEALHGMVSLETVP
jgi:phosphoribosylformylglycinamidine synthase II